ALSSPESLCRYCECGFSGASFSSHRSQSPSNPPSSSLINTLEVMCMALTSTKPSFTPDSSMTRWTSTVMLVKPRRAGRENQSSLRWDFMDCSNYRHLAALYLQCRHVQTAPASARPVCRRLHVAHCAVAPG